MNSNWGLRLCLPVQPVFAYQSYDVYVFWGFALFPENNGELVKRACLFVPVPKSCPRSCII
ncbi:hypothetical protein PEX1_019570 [Penicillium expansum]|nr:hypothetical protein PEX1_019570 [Penicillium expansum]